MSLAPLRLEPWSCSGFSRSFGAVNALRDVDLTVRRGEFVALLGPLGLWEIDHTQLRRRAAWRSPLAEFCSMDAALTGFARSSSGSVSY